MADLVDIAPYLEGLFLAETMQDWIQTTRFLRDGQTEMNPLLGPHPSQAKMTGFGVGMDALQFAGYQAMPDKYKFPYAAISAVLEGANVYRNKRETGYPLDKPALALGALLTGLIVNSENNSKKNRLGFELQKRDSTLVPMVNMKW